MLHNHLKLAYRQLLQQKSYALVHITGLGIGEIVATYLTISFQTIQLAQRPPVEALRDQE